MRGAQGIPGLSLTLCSFDPFVWIFDSSVRAIEMRSKPIYRVGAKMSLQTINLPGDKTVNLRKVYDAVIIGSGRAGFAICAPTIN